MSGEDKYKGHRKKEATLEDEEMHLAQLKQNLYNIGLSGTKKKTAEKSSVKLLINDILSSRNTEQLYTALGKFFLSKNTSFFKKLEAALISSDYNNVIEIYVGKMILVSSLAFMISSVFFGIGISLSLLGFNIAYISVPFIISAIIFFILFYIPFERVSSKRRSIDINMPFALTHLSAIASSGTPPEEAFRIMSTFTEFGSVSTETLNIIKRIDVFGEDITTSLKQVIDTTPSESFREILSGILTITQTGGNLDAYLSEMAKIAMFDYKLAREKYISALSTYADIYTALLIAAPLFLVSILVVMNIIPNTTLPGNLSIMDALSIGVYGLIPMLNLLFLAFITFTTPEM